MVSTFTVSPSRLVSVCFFEAVAADFVLAHDTAKNAQSVAKKRKFFMAGSSFRRLLCGVGKKESVELQYMIFGKSNKGQNEKKS
jgi:hypothetical protein